MSNNMRTLNPQNNIPQAPGSPQPEITLDSNKQSSNLHPIPNRKLKILIAIVIITIVTLGSMFLAYQSYNANKY